jgi:hypothetical protein
MVCDWLITNHPSAIMQASDKFWRNQKVEFEEAPQQHASAKLSMPASALSYGAP